MSVLSVTCVVLQLVRGSSCHAAFLGGNTLRGHDNRLYSIAVVIA